MAGRRPFDPGRFGFYYGWVILVVGTVGMLASFPGQTAGVSVFTEHLSDATGLTRLRLATAYLIGTTCSGLLLPFGGRWVDTVGSRVVAFGATCGLAVTLMALSFVGPMSPLTGLIVMSIGFGFLRFCGQGLLTLSSRTMISQWFDRRRGLVSSGSSAAFAFVFSLTPTLLFALVELSDFRWAWRQLAVGLVVILGTMILIFYRNTPEECGLMIDGDTPPAPGSDAEAAGNDAGTGSASRTATPSTAGRADGPSFTRGQAIRDVRFWIVTLPIFSLSVVGTALTFHIVDLGEEVGLDESTIVLIFVPIALISIPITLVAGWLADTISVLRLAVAMAALQLVMYLTVAELAHPVLRIVAVISWGGASGLRAALMAAALPRLFGRAHLGSIAGAQMSALVIGSALGPFLFAWIEAAAGSYQRALVISLVGPVTGLALAGYNHVTQRPTAPHDDGASAEPMDA
jgi:MFS family permease